MATSEALVLTLNVNKILPLPINASAGVAVFRSSVQGQGLTDSSIRVINGVAKAITAPMKCLVLRTDLPLTVTVTDGGGSKAIAVTSLMVLTDPTITGISIAYTDSGLPDTAYATVSVIFT